MAFAGAPAAQDSHRFRDPRANLQLEVRVWGLDEAGKPFSNRARTIEIGALGARLSGLRGCRQNDVIGIQYGDQKARFRVAWVGSCGSELEGQVGVECAEAGKCIWMAALESAQSSVADGSLPAHDDVSRSSNAAQQSWPSSERRRYPRYPCSGTIMVQQPGGEVVTHLKLVDLCLGGCYGETLSPLPVGTKSQLILRVGQVQITTNAEVRTCHVGMGNGFGFTEINSEEWKKLANVVNQLGSGQVVSDLPSNPEMIDGLEALIAILQRKGVLSRGEVLGELARRRSAN